MHENTTKSRPHPIRALDRYLSQRIMFDGEERTVGAVLLEMQRENVPPRCVDAYIMGALHTARRNEATA